MLVERPYDRDGLLEGQVERLDIFSIRSGRTRVFQEGV